MHIGAVVVELGPVLFREQEHRGQRRHTQFRHILPEEQPRGDIHHRRVAGRDDKAVGAGNRRAFQRGIDGDRRAADRPALGVKAREAGEFLALGRCGVQGKSPRRKPIGRIAPKRAEIARADKGDQLVELVQTVQGCVQPDARHAGQAAMFGHLLGQIAKIFEIIGGKAHLGGHAFGHFENPHRLGEEPAHVEGGQTELAACVVPAGMIIAELDQPVVVIVQRPEKALGRRCGHMRLRRKLAHLFAERVKAELLRRRIGGGNSRGGSRIGGLCPQRAQRHHQRKGGGTAKQAAARYGGGTGRGFRHRGL